MNIKFGTSGWRDIIAEGFTFPNLRVCSQAIADEIIRQKNHNKPVVVGYDTRFMSDLFAYEAARILANNGIETRFSDRDVPTPVVAYEIIRSQAAGGINITASHNPYDYNGLKFSSSWGGPALRETTDSIETTCTFIASGARPLKNTSADPRLSEKLISRVDFRRPYIDHVRQLLDETVFKKRKLKIVVDVLYGTSRGYLPDLLRELGCEVTVIHDERDVTFAGGGPDPSESKLAELIAMVKKTKAHLGLACDGDADRFGIVDAGGVYFEANEILSLLAWHIHVSRKFSGILARSVMTTHAIDAIAKKYGLTLKETPVGFKYIGEIMKEAESITPSTEGEFVMGGEESGGFTMRGHVPEKDGILACLLVAEMVASSEKSLAEHLQNLHKNVGVYLSRRINIKATAELVASLKDRFSRKPPTEIDGLSVHRIVDLDGFKFIFQNGNWMGIRFSGTEPVIRVYYEGNSEKQLDILKKAAESLIHLTPSSSARAKHPVGY